VGTGAVTVRLRAGVIITAESYLGDDELLTELLILPVRDGLA
jgi:hypothetical protein